MNVPGARPGTDHCAVRSSAAGTAPQEGADRHWAVALAAPQREEFGVDDVVAAGPSAGTEPSRKANPRRGLGRGRRQQGSGNDKRSESPSHLVLLGGPSTGAREATHGQAPQGIEVSFCWLRLAKMRAADR